MALLKLMLCSELGLHLFLGFCLYKNSGLTFCFAPAFHLLKQSPTPNCTQMCFSCPLNQFGRKGPWLLDFGCREQSCRQRALTKDELQLNNIILLHLCLHGRGGGLFLFFFFKLTCLKRKYIYICTTESLLKEV
uniref:Uncharacterized protein n=1 Tax=Sphaerodactylus townsendi TaxID=933632 RepID=A0ACB8F5S7_9SAUR